MTRGKWLALLLGLGGVSLIASPSFTGAGEMTGALLALVSALGLAVGSVVVKRAGNREQLLTLTTWQLILGGLPLLAASLVWEQGASLSWTREFTALLLFLAVVGTAISTAAWYKLIQSGDIGRLSMFFFLVPVYGMSQGIRGAGATFS
mgnify:CR=1 FL=1